MTERPNALRRPICERCKRPSRVCLCSVLPLQPIHTNTCITIIQTPAESRAKVKTADIVCLCLANATILFSTKHPDAAIPPDAVILFPGETSQPLDQLSEKPHTLVLLDSTWDKAKRLLARSSFLQSLQRVSIPDKYLGPPIFKARKSPTHSIKSARSTAEAAAAALQCVEGDHAITAITAIRRVVNEASEMQLRFIRSKGPTAGRHRVNRTGYEPGLYAETSNPEVQPST